jgi:starch phosphorylase
VGDQLVQEVSPECSGAEAGSSRRSGRLLRVLIVEDSANDAELIAHELERSGLMLTWERVATDEEFLTQLSFPVDLVLADYTMPAFGANRALEILQERASTIPFVVVSGTIGEDAAVSIVKRGATDYVLKSNLGQLGQKVTLALQGQRKIAYFSMEIALASDMHTYSGGLGVLAGDTIRSAADLQVPMVAVSLVHRMGYFRQHVDAAGHQSEERSPWPVESFLEKLKAPLSVRLDTRTVRLAIWKYEVIGVGGYCVPVYLLDSNLPENSAWDRALTDELYGGDWYYRVCQEMVLGMGGLAALRALGYDRIDRFHMNEGHAGLLTIGLLQEQAARGGRDQINISDLAAVRRRCIFTTHTPVAVGHDQFPMQSVSQLLWHRSDPSPNFDSDTAARVFGRRTPGKVTESSDTPGPTLNLTYLALNLSRYVNGVAKKHGEISRRMFEGYAVDAITNGVHAATWACPPFQELFDRYIPDWRQDNFSLRHALDIPRRDIRAAHQAAKKELLAFVNAANPGRTSEEIFTIGFARRATAYKRADLLFSNVDALRQLSQEFGPVQILFSGKAHPRDTGGKAIIEKIHAMKELLAPGIVILFIEDYDMEIAKRLVAGVDLWLNTPQPPMEASGTSGMKAAINGVPSLSTLDGWWIEGHIEGITGWCIGGKQDEPGNDTASEAASLYDKLGTQILPMFYDDAERYTAVMQHAIALNGSFFNTQRMLQQYVLRAYFP